ncbi:unnamed protein product [Peronospora belbahrii]|uniref:Uncharacterized protein n=1 Tax=Peronospora belbahrii TaxID=622444 RepID=A0AAU9L1T1_9STRA|nr:unnamed protein product [Peronospora belbahrii]
MLCVVLFTTFNIVQTLAFRTYPRRSLAGIHHTIKYAPKVVEQPVDKNALDSYDSYDSYDLRDSDEASIELKDSEEIEMESSKDLNLDVDGSVDAKVMLEDGEDMEYSADGNQEVDITSLTNVDFSAEATLDCNEKLNSLLDFESGSLDIMLDDDESYTQDLELEDDEDVDEIIEIPEGAKLIRLRVHKGNVDLDIIKSDKMDVTETNNKEQPNEAQKKKKTEKTHKEEEPHKEKVEAVSTESKEQSVSYAAKAKDWLHIDVTKSAYIGSIIGAAVGIVGVVGVAIAKKRASAKSEATLSENVATDVAAGDNADDDNAMSESLSESESDEDVEAGVTVVAEEDAVEEKKKSVVEGSV